jgi:RecB family exonuclease
VRSDDEQPSVYLDLVDPLPDESDGQRPFTEVRRAMTLPTLVAQLRRELVDDDEDKRAVAVGALARLAAEGVPGADPSGWWALRDLSDDRPLRSADEPVRISPSKVESFGQCGLRWLFSACGGDGPSVGAASIGTLVHDIAAELGDVDAARLRAEVDARWGRLGLPAGWASDRKRTEAHAMVGWLARYFERAEQQGWQRLGAELEMKVTLGRAVVSGRVDRLERLPDGSLRVIDYKTGSSKPREDDLPTHPQLGAYQVAVDAGAFGEHGTTCGGAALLQIGKGANRRDITLQEQRPLHTHDDPDWAQRLIAETAEGMAGATFTATVGTWCEQCAVRSSCPAQPEGKTL